MEPTASEAVYAFAAWLTTREASITMGRHHLCGPVTEVVREFVKHNEWVEPGPRYPDNFSMPPG